MRRPPEVTDQFALRQPSCEAQSKISVVFGVAFLVGVNLSSNCLCVARWRGTRARGTHDPAHQTAPAIDERLEILAVFCPVLALFITKT